MIAKRIARRLAQKEKPWGWREKPKPKMQPETVQSLAAYALAELQKGYSELAEETTALQNAKTVDDIHAVLENFDDTGWEIGQQVAERAAESGLGNGFQLCLSWPGHAGDEISRWLQAYLVSLEFEPSGGGTMMGDQPERNEEWFTPENMTKEAAETVGRHIKQKYPTVESGVMPVV